MAISMKQLLQAQLLVVVMVGCMLVLISWRSGGGGAHAQDAQQCINDAETLWNQCSSNDDQATCCAAFGQFLQNDGSCVCQAVAAGTLDPYTVYQITTPCHTTIPAYVTACLNKASTPSSGYEGASSGYEGASMKSNCIGTLLVFFLGLALII